MNNIPTDLLRTLIAVVDFRSFTKAAQALGVTQPAVSAQIKRLHGLLGVDLFDRSAPGVVLTAKGKSVVDHARRLLAINDQIVGLTGDKKQSPTISIGLPGDLPGPLLPWVLAKYRKRWPEFNFRVRTGLASAMLSELRQGDIDIVMAMSLEEPTDARHVWLDQLAWGRSDATAIDPSQPVAMLAFNDECRCYRAGVASLQEAGREHRLVMTAPTMMALCAGVDAGLGTVVMTRGRMRMTTLTRWDDAPLPPLPQMHVGIYVRGGADTEPLNDLADEFVPLLRPKPDDADSKSGEYQVVQAAFAQVASSLKKVAN